MKSIFIAMIFILTLNSCSKNNSESNSLVGNWNVVNDSSVNTNKFYTLSGGDSGNISSNYNGEQCGATFSFSSTGNLGTSFYDCIYGFGPTIDSAKYIITNSQVEISIYAQSLNCCTFTNFNPVVSRTYNISNLTANTATLTYSQGINNLTSGESTATEIINLKR